MTLLVLLIIFILLFYVLPRLAPYILKWMVRRQVRRFEKQMGYRAAGKGSKETRQQPTTRKRRKKIDPTVGEYVKYHEVDATKVTYTETRPDGTTQRVTATEEQVTDAEWEELPDTSQNP